MKHPAMAACGRSTCVGAHDSTSRRRAVERVVAAGPDAAAENLLSFPARKACGAARPTRQQSINCASQGGTAHEKAACHSRGRRRPYCSAPRFTPTIFRRGRSLSCPCSVPAAPATRSAASSPIRSARRSSSRSSSRTVPAPTARSPRTTSIMRPAGRLHAVDGDQFAAVRRSVPAQGRQLRPVKDFAPVTRVGSFTLMLVINPNLPIHSVKELVDYAKANPGKLSFASGNTAGIVGGETLAHWAGIDMLHVPYKSSPPAHRGRHRRPRLDDDRRLHHRHAACRVRHAARARGDADQALVAVPRSADHGRGRHRRALNSTPGPASSRRPARRRTSSPSSTARCARSSTAPTSQGEIPQRRLRRLFLDARRARRLHQGPARQMGQDGQGRQHPGGLIALILPREAGRRTARLRGGRGWTRRSFCDDNEAPSQTPLHRASPQPTLCVGVLYVLNGGRRPPSPFARVLRGRTARSRSRGAMRGECLQRRLVSKRPSARSPALSVQRKSERSTGTIANPGFHFVQSGP